MHIFLIIGLILLSSCTEKTPENFLSGVKFSSEQINISNFYQDKKAKGPVNTSALRNDQDEVLRIKTESISKAEEAQKIIDQKSNEIKMMFAPQQVPYQGVISKDINCTQAVEVNNKILETDKEISLIINLTATDRFIYGSCIAEQEIYKSQLLMLYCKANQNFYEIKYFYDKSLAYKPQIAHCN